jgi:flavin-dependent dehydrogenase
MRLSTVPAKTQVVVVGGGPAGSSTAWHLARLGVEVVLVDRARFPRDKPCAEYLSPEGSRILQAMGVLQRIEAAGAAQLTGMLIKAPSGATIRGEFAASHGFRGFRDSGLALPRVQLDHMLLNAARSAGVTIVEGAKVESLLRDSRGSCTGAKVRVGECVSEIRAQVVIGADGLRSIVSRRLGLAHTSRWPKRFAFVAHYRGVRGIASVGEMHVTRNGYVGLADVGHGLTNVALVMPKTRGKSFSSSPNELLARWLHMHPELARRFLGAERVGNVTATGPFASHARSAWSAGAALVGDAADFFDPFTGEGIYAALRGGELLAPFVYDAVQSTSANSANLALHAYDRARRTTFVGKWRVEKMIGLSVAHPWLLERAASVLARDPDLADLLVGVAGDFIPPRELVRASVLRRVLRQLLLPNSSLLAEPHHAHRS